MGLEFELEVDEVGALDSVVDVIEEVDTIDAEHKLTCAALSHFVTDASAGSRSPYVEEVGDELVIELIDDLLGLARRQVKLPERTGQVGFR